MNKDSSTSVTQVVETIILGIENKTFEVGKRIPSQRQLATLFGVSRTVIREAIKVLEGKNILISREGSGTYVRQGVGQTQYSDIDNLSKFSLADIIQFSRLIWNASIPIVIKETTDEELSVLVKRTEKFYNNYSSTTTIQEKFIYESSFGMSICKLTHNKLIYKLMTELLKATSDIDFRLVASNGTYKNILEIDKKIVASLVDRNELIALLWCKERDIEISKIIDSKSDIKAAITNKEYTINIVTTY
ncbi:FadR/GntR family transcriptional regulator [Tissierella carlieri]|uniref:FadR/GntR family transcriptional regulator n=1 Tax=Tissierella carlieri TaxID=689904 RepID=UPI00386869CF